jgi:hypothetical protein
MTDLPPEQSDTEPDDPNEATPEDEGTNVDGDGDLPDGQADPPSKTD